MKISQQVLDEPNANPVPNLGVRVRRKRDGVTLATVTTDADGFALIQGDGHYPPFFLQTTNQVGGPRIWSSDDTLAAGALSPAEVPYALRAFGDGYIPGFLDNLAVSLNGTTLSLATGGALVAGYPVINYTADTFSLERPSSGTRVDRLVVRVYGEAHEDHGLAEFAILAGTTDAGTPALTQTTSVYEVSLASVTVPSAGSLTLVDDRVTVLVLLSRKNPVTGVARAASASTSDTSGVSLLEFDLSLTESATYDIEAEFAGYQASVTSASYPWELKFGSFGSGDSNFNTPGQIARDSSGNIYIADTNNNRVKRHSSSGAYVDQVTSGSSTAAGVCVDASGSVYLTVNTGVRGYLARFPSDLSTATWTISLITTNFSHCATDGTHVYVTASDHKVHKYLCATGALVASFGGSGSADGKFTTPAGIATDGTYLYVADQGNDRIQKFTLAGVFVTKWGASGTNNGQFSTPVAIAVNPVNGNIYVTDTGRDDVQEFTNTGTFVGRFGTFGSGDGQLNNPTGVVVSADGADVYIAESGNNRVQRFNTGTVLGGYGSVAVAIDGNVSSYAGMGALNGTIGNAHTRSVSGPATVTVAGYGKAMTDTIVLNGCVLSARAVPRL